MAVMDTGFPKWGGGGLFNLLFNQFPQKLHENKENWGERRGRTCSLNLPMNCIPIQKVQSKVLSAEIIELKNLDSLASYQLYWKKKTSQIFA